MSKRQQQETENRGGRKDRRKRTKENREEGRGKKEKSYQWP
jgi:hypothetical protein